MTPHEAPLVDSHFHIWRDDLPLIRAAWHRPPSNASVELALEVLDAHGVTVSVAGTGISTVADNRGQFTLTTSLPAQCS